MALSLFSLFIGSICDFLAAAFLARFIMQWRRIPFGNPVGRFVVALTDWAVLPARKFIPGLFGLDIPSLTLAWVVQTLFWSIVIGASGIHGGATGGGFISAMIVGMIEVMRTGMYLGMLVIIISAVLSWVSPYAPIAPLLRQLADPMLRPFQRFIPPVGGVDLSPLAALLVLQAILLILDRLKTWVLFTQ